MIKTLRTFFFPIERAELPKFVPIFLMGFLICFNYYILRCLKDTVAIASTQMGAGVIPFLKIWGVLPAAIFSAFCLSRLFRKYRREQIFYWVVGAFLFFFAIFALMLYPNREALSFKGGGGPLPLEILRQWPLALFYIMAELWKVVVLMVLFWGFVNTQTNAKEAARFYGPVMLGGSLAGMVAGSVACASGENWESSLGLQTVIVVIVGLITLILFWHYQHSTLWIKANYEPIPTGLTEDTPRPRSAFEAFKKTLLSPTLLALALIIVTDYVAFSLVEILWKETTFSLYPDPVDFNRYHGKILIWTSIASFFGGLVISTNILKRFGWTVGALITPAILLATSLLFFGCQLAVEWNSLALFWGAIHNILGRASRQAFLDPTKEMAYLPLPSELQIQGKTFVDGICPTLGKTGGALVQQGVVFSAKGLGGSLTFCSSLTCLCLTVAITSVIRIARKKPRDRLLITPKEKEKRRLTG